MFEFAVLADRRGLAVALRLGAVDPERGNGLLREQLAEFLANGNQGREVFDVAAGERIFDHGDRRRAPGRRRDRLSHFQIGLFDNRDDLANDRAHRVPPCVRTRLSMHQPFHRVCRGRRAQSGPLDRFRRDHERLAMQAQCGAVDQPHREQPARTSRTGFERRRDLAPRQFADASGDKPRAEVAVGLQIMRRATDDGGMSGQIDGIGDDGGGSVGLRCGPPPKRLRHRQCRAKSCCRGVPRSQSPARDHRRRSQSFAVIPRRPADPSGRPKNVRHRPDAGRCRRHY